LLRDALMGRLRGIAARLRSLIGASSAERRMEEEFAFHVDMETSRRVATGIGQDEARRGALVAFGGLEQHRESMRDDRGARWLSDLSVDIRYALRGMRRSPGFALAVALTLGLGVGVNGITFGMVNSLLLRPLPVSQPDRLVGLYTRDTRSGDYGQLAWDDYVDLRDRSGIFDGLAGRTDGPLNMVLPTTGGSQPVADLVWGEFVTENYFSVIGMRAELGRLFTESDAPQGANAFAVLSYDAWKTRFQGDPGVVGRVVRLNGTPFTITGVTPEGFRGIRTFGFWTEVWAPIGMHRTLLPGSAQLLSGRGAGWLMAIGRLKEGSTQERAQEASTRFAQQLALEYPATHERLGLTLLSAAAGFDNPSFVKPDALQLASALGVFASLIMLLIICANLANLQMARSAARSREFAIRLSLGCSRPRLVRQLGIEALLLALPGALIAAAMTGMSPVIESYMVPRLQFRVGFNPTVDIRVAVFTAAVALLAVALFGLAPALKAARPALVSSLSSVAGGRRQRTWGTRGLLVVSQLALSVVLLVAGTLFVRSLVLARAADVGFNPSDRVLLSANVSLQGYDATRGLRFYSDVLDRVRANPAVTSASWMFPVPFDTYGRSRALYVDGMGGNAPDQTTSFDLSVADVGFVDALGLRLAAGRGFTIADSSGAPPVMIVSQQLAARLWPGQDPIGRRARDGGASGPEITVIGVVGDAKFATIGPASQARVYLPLRQHYRGWQTLVIHARGNAALITRDASSIVSSLDPALPTFGATTMRASVASGFSTQQTAAALGGFFGLLALMIASIGLYAVVAGSVTEKTREIGVRMALGASPGGVMRFVITSGARLGLVGFVVGLTGAFGVAMTMRSLLVGVSPIDPVTFGLVPAILVAVVFIATFLPARRAVRLDPVAALRND
jgi:predicted permease